jgi:hypothetical protein
MAASDAETGEDVGGALVVRLREQKSAWNGWSWSARASISMSPISS